MESPVWPAVLYAGLALLLVAALLGLSWLLGERHRGPSRNIPYESGAEPAGGGRVHFQAHYYLVAVLFLLFDLEGAFLLAWAVAFRDLGWSGYAAAALFLATLAAGLVFVWKEGALDWNRPERWRNPERALEPGEETP
ncbi:MAG: NADH-quinone oxidoreductase subunit A [Candidatus Eisenbacteria bacterium]|nr:NADH-quinone oxidoreductase subunit A [Candidatus Eisenbacteria bacterium]